MKCPYDSYCRIKTPACDSKHKQLHCKERQHRIRSGCPDRWCEYNEYARSGNDFCIKPGKCVKKQGH